MDEIAPDIERLLNEEIESVRQLEVLLHLRAGAPRAYTAEEVSAALRSGPGWTEEQLQDLRAKGLLEELRASPPAYRYAPGDRAALVDEVDRLFARRKPKVIELIFGGPEPAARTEPGVRRRT